VISASQVLQIQVRSDDAAERTKVLDSAGYTP
jgi:hypothetical protein